MCPRRAQCNNFGQTGKPVCMRRENNIRKFDYYALLFFALSFLGWLWEVVLYFWTEHRFINRGVYEGPYLPVYGVGGLLLYFFLHSWQKKPIKVFLYSALICGVLEYFTSYFLEQRWGIRWWDYSGHFLNISGRVCLLGVSAFGVGGVLLICLFLPFYEKWYQRLPPRLKLILCILLVLIFAADAAWCAMHPNMGYGITQDLW